MIVLLHARGLWQWAVAAAQGPDRDRTRSLSHAAKSTGDSTDSSSKASAADRGHFPPLRWPRPPPRKVRLGRLHSTTTISRTRAALCPLAVPRLTSYGALLSLCLSPSFFPRVPPPTDTSRLVTSPCLAFRPLPDTLTRSFARLLCVCPCLPLGPALLLCSIAVAALAARPSTPLLSAADPLTFRPQSSPPRTHRPALAAAFRCRHPSTHCLLA